MKTDPIILAVPKGRILKELMPLLTAAGIKPEDAFRDESSRKLRFKTNDPGLDIIRVRSFDAATFIAYGGAHFGVVGQDVLEEYNYDELYAPLDLNIGTCRLSIAVPSNDADTLNFDHHSHIRIATKYPNLTTRHFAQKGIQAECIKLNGAMEIAPSLDLSGMIVDLVSTGSTLKANNLIEVDTILNISSKLVIGRTALKTMPKKINAWIAKFRNAVETTS